MKKCIMKDKFKKIRPIIFWLFVWFLFALGVGKEVIFPSPWVTIKALGGILLHPVNWLSIIVTILRVLGGFSLALTIGIITGTICGFNERVYRYLKPMMTMIRSTPVMSIILIAILWFRQSNVPLFIAFLMCFPIIWQNTMEGIRSVDKNLLEMAEVYNISKHRVLLEIYWPSLVPFIMAGFKTALGIGWKVTVAAEVLSHPKYSIGENLYNASIYIDTPSLFAWTLVIIILSFLIEVLFVDYLDKKFDKYY